MNKKLRNICTWGVGLTAYAVLVLAYFALLFEWNPLQLLRTQEQPEEIISVGQGKHSHRTLVEKSDEAGGVLLPLGPDDGRLPGLPIIWSELLRSGKTDVYRLTADGFDGLQAVAELADLASGAIAELFLAAVPRQVFRRGDFLLLLDDRDRVLVIDCQNPAKPKISGSLPFPAIRNMEMRGDIAYLQISQSLAPRDVMLVVDLKDPQKPRHINRFSLPENTLSFFFQDQRLVVYSSTRGPNGGHTLHLFELTDDSGIVPLGQVESPNLSKGYFPFDNTLVIADLHAGVRVYDVSDPLRPVYSASLDFPDRIKYFARHGDLLLGSSFGNRIYIMDLHDPVHPLLSSVVEGANQPAFMLEYDDYAYYFSLQGFLRVFDVQPFESFGRRATVAAGPDGELVPSPGGNGFTLLGAPHEPLSAGIAEVVAMPVGTHLVDTLSWQGLLVTLDDQGLLQFFAREQDGALRVRQRLQLKAPQRWLTASRDRIYAGGEASVDIIANNRDGLCLLSGQLELRELESWDGIVVQNNLCVAAGEKGPWCFSLENPDRPEAGPEWSLPRQLRDQVDVRRLVSVGDNRVLLAAGTAGLVGGRVEGGQFLFDAIFKLQAPVNAVTAINGLCLVSTGREVVAIDIRSPASLQNLGKIAFPGVTRFAAVEPDFWAGYVPGEGWSTLPAPEFVLPGELEALLDAAPAAPLPGRTYQYRLKLFNDRQVTTVPGVLSLPRGRKPVAGSRS